VLIVTTPGGADHHKVDVLAHTAVAVAERHRVQHPPRRPCRARSHHPGAASSASSSPTAASPSAPRRTGGMLASPMICFRKVVPVASAESKVAAICALYSAERADCSSIFANTLAVLGFAVAYGAVIVSVLQSAISNGLALAFLPVPLAVIVCFHSIMVGLNGVRATSVLLIERKLLTIIDDGSFYEINDSGERMPKIGNWVGESKIFSPKYAPAGRWISFFALNVAIVLGTLLLCVWAIIRSFSNYGGFVAYVAAVVIGLLYLLTRAVRKVVLPGQRLFLSLGAGRMRWDESRSSGSPPL